ncbi:MAG TPA: type II toxin-antitoxin system RelE/ParE family toxin [Terriglobia bacterium]
MYLIEFLPRALEELRGAGSSDSQHILRRLRWLADHLDSMSPEALKSNLAGLFKFRVGDYRIIYEVDRRRKIVTVHLVGHRREIYS